MIPVTCQLFNDGNVNLLCPTLTVACLIPDPHCGHGSQVETICPGVRTLCGSLLKLKKCRWLEMLFWCLSFFFVISHSLQWPLTCGSQGVMCLFNFPLCAKVSQKTNTCLLFTKFAWTKTLHTHTYWMPCYIRQPVYMLVDDSGGDGGSMKTNNSSICVYAKRRRSAATN